jgi:hypothetical protein
MNISVIASAVEQIQRLAKQKFSGGLVAHAPRNDGSTCQCEGEPSAYHSSACLESLK